MNIVTRTIRALLLAGLVVAGTLFYGAIVSAVLFGLAWGAAHCETNCQALQAGTMIGGLAALGFYVWCWFRAGGWLALGLIMLVVAGFAVCGLAIGDARISLLFWMYGGPLAVCIAAFVLFLREPAGGG